MRGIGNGQTRLAALRVAQNSALHEDLSREESIRAGLDRSFGLIMAGGLGAIGAISWWVGGAHRIWWLAGAGAFLAAALLAPRLLHPLNLLWLKLGLLLHHIVSPLVLGMMFYPVFVRP